MNRHRFCGALVLSIFLLAGSLGQARAAIVPGDFDNDCDVDGADFQHFRTCALGMGVAQTNPLCADAKLDADADGRISAIEAANNSKVAAGFTTSDADKDGYLSKTEFAQMASSMNQRGTPPPRPSSSSDPEPSTPSDSSETAPRN